MSHFEHPSFVVVKIDFDYWTKNIISHESGDHDCNKSNLHENAPICSFLTRHNLVFVKMWIFITALTLNLNFEWGTEHENLYISQIEIELLDQGVAVLPPRILRKM